LLPFEVKLAQAVCCSLPPGGAVKEKLQEYALIAEIISSMAVVITLVILIL
jgi:hypothetical protein